MQVYRFPHSSESPHFLKVITYSKIKSNSFLPAAAARRPQPLRSGPASQRPVCKAAALPSRTGVGSEFPLGAFELQICRRNGGHRGLLPRYAQLYGGGDGHTDRRPFMRLFWGSTGLLKVLRRTSRFYGFPFVPACIALLSSALLSSQRKSFAKANSFAQPANRLFP